MGAIAFIRAYWKPAAVFLLLMMVWLHGDHNGAERVDSRWQLATMTASAKAARNAVAAEQAARKQEQEAQARVAAAEAAGYAALQEKQRENDSLRAAVDVGHRRLLIKATCPAAVPGPAQDPGMGDGATAELTADARPDYFDLRAGITHQHQQLVTCQDILAGLVR